MPHAQTAALLLALRAGRAARTGKSRVWSWSPAFARKYWLPLTKSFVPLTFAASSIEQGLTHTSCLS